MYGVRGPFRVLRNRINADWLKNPEGYGTCDRILHVLGHVTCPGRGWGWGAIEGSGTTEELIEDLEGLLGPQSEAIMYDLSA